jgi:hypothetical protein
MAYVCQCCGQAHDGLPLDIGFAKPGAYLALKTRQQKARCQLTPDVCIMGKKRFFIRGCLPIPLHETGSVFVWGLWAEVSSHVFERYQQQSDSDASDEVPCPGSLSVEREPLLRGMDRLPVLIQFGPARQRPTFVLEPSNHWLCRDQENGLTLHRLHEILHAMFPQHF